MFVVRRAACDCSPTNDEVVAMLAINKILFPTDLSTCAERAFQHAAFLADWHDAELLILNVAGRHMHDYREMRDGFPYPEADLAAMLADDRQDERHLPELGALRIRQEQVEKASAAAAIRDYGEAHDVDLVVMGTHGRRGASRLLIGSVAEEVVRTANRPVFTVRADGAVAPGQAVRRILVPLDFSDLSEQALLHAKELALTYGARLDLLHVVEEITLPNAYGMEPVNILVPEVVENSERYLADMAKRVLGHEHVVAHVVPGYAVSTILDFAGRNAIDLMVIATHGRTGLERLMMGSVAERVVRRAPCPVFTVKSFGKTLVSAGGDEAEPSSVV